MHALRGCRQDQNENMTAVLDADTITARNDRQHVERCPSCGAGPLWYLLREYLEHLVACARIVAGLLGLASGVSPRGEWHKVS